MTISLNWLKSYIDIDLAPEEISNLLTSLGLEVEGMEEVESIKGGLEGVIVGHVKECWRHPNADKLSLTKVDIGGDDLLQIVCGAPNVAAGQKVSAGGRPRLSVNTAKLEPGRRPCGFPSHLQSE